MCNLMVAGLWLACAACPPDQPGRADEASRTPYARWENGPSSDPHDFPIAVWLQAPRNARRFREAGINLYVGLWRGPTEEQLAALQDAGMPVICDLNEVALKSEHAGVIVGWMHGDEPDNAQARPGGGGYDPPIPPSRIEADYRRTRQRDGSRPVLLNLGQGVAFDQWIGRGVRTNHPEDYLEYVKGCDIVSFDIYPVVDDRPAVAGKLEFVAQGVERLRRWTRDEKIVWNCIECSRISNTQVKPTVEQIRSEVWMSLIHGSRGLIYFVHQFQPEFKEAALLDDAELLPGVTAINRQIRELAPVLNSPTVERVVEVASRNPAAPIAAMCKQYEGATYLFAVCMRNESTQATIQLLAASSAAEVEVLGENRSVPLRDNGFSDRFEPYAVHLYRIAGLPGG